MTGGRDELLYNAKLAHQLERYEDMVEFVKRLVKLETEMTTEERNMFSIAYKQLLNSWREPLKMIKKIQQMENVAVERNYGEDVVNDYLKTLEDNLIQICDEIHNVVTEHAIPGATSSESKIFFHKMSADYQRYKAEFTSGKTRKDAACSALLSYKLATHLATSDLPATDPIRLGLALNFSVFYGDILHSSERAAKLALAAYHEATAELQSLSEKSYRDSTLILQALRNNLTLWSDSSSQKNQLQ